MTGLQVVANQGWVIPYVACMLVLFGMISHFGGVFLRFASRYDRGAIPTANAVQPVKTKTTLPIIVCTAWPPVSCSFKAMRPKRHRPKKPRSIGMRLARFR